MILLSLIVTLNWYITKCKQMSFLKKIFGGNFTILFFQGRGLCHLDFIALKQMTVITEDKVLRKGVKLSLQQPWRVRMTLEKQNRSAERNPLNEIENHLLWKTILFSYLAGCILLSLLIMAIDGLCQSLEILEDLWSGFGNKFLWPYFLRLQAICCWPSVALWEHKAFICSAGLGSLWQFL